MDNDNNELEDNDNDALEDNVVNQFIDDEAESSELDCSSDDEDNFPELDDESEEDKGSALLYIKTSVFLILLKFILMYNIKIL